MTVGEYIDALYALIDELEGIDESEELTIIPEEDGTVIYLVGDQQIQDYKQSLS